MEFRPFLALRRAKKGPPKGRALKERRGFIYQGVLPTR